MTTEGLTQALGKPGKFQVLLYIMLGSNFTFVCWNHLGMAFMGAKTKYHCHVDNQTDVDQLVPVIIKDGVKTLDGCHLYSDYNKTMKMPCSSWTYQQPNREHTIVAEWDLVCGDDYKVGLSTTVYFCGVALSSLVFGTLSDKFGRRPVILFTMYSPIAVGLALFFIRHYVAFAIFRFLLGFLLQGVQMTSFIAIVEVLAIQYRTVVGVLIGVFWGAGIVSLALIAYLIQNWRYIQLFTMVGCVFQIGLICFLPESHRWLLTKKRFVEAEAVVKKITKFNKKEFPREIFDEVVESIEAMDTETLKPTTNYTIIDLFRIPVLRYRSLVMALVWFSTSLSYYGLTLNISSFAGNKYLNFAISGMIEALVVVAVVFILKRFGRRRPLCFFSIVAGVTCLTAGVISEVSAAKDMQTVIALLALTGRISLGGNFSTIFIYTSELYPTVIRNVGLGAGIFWARIGSITAPQVLLLGFYTSNAVPIGIFGGFVFLAGILCLFLPETLNVRLPETMEDAGNFIKVQREVLNSDYGDKVDCNVELIEKVNISND